MKWVPLIFLTLAFAGCSEDPAPAGPSDDPENPNFMPNELDVPVWAVGDVWEYQTSNGIIKLAVSGVEGDYTLDTNDTRIAFFDEQFDISYIGTMSRDHLTGSQGGSPVKFFDFPLYHNKTWSTNWDGEPLEIMVQETADDVYHIQALRDGVMVNEYQYSNATRFFDWISFTDGEGSENYRMDLISRGSGWNGQLVRTTSEPVITYGPGGSTSVYNFDPVDADLYLDIQYACTTGAFAVAIGPVEGIPPTASGNEDGFSRAGPCPIDERFAGVVSTTPEVGTWGHAIAGVEAMAGTLWLREYERIDL
jgi:hypothetical protein